MEEKENARAVIGEIIAAYNSGDTDALVALCQPDISFWSAISGSHIGTDAVREYVDRLHQTLPAQQVQAKAVVADGDLVVAEIEATGTTHTANAYLIGFTATLESRDGRVTTAKIYLNPAEIERVLR